MNKLALLQQYAEKIAAKLGVDCQPTLRWSGGTCRTKPHQAAHCHISSATLPRGTICLAHVKGTVLDWRYTIRHEVAHLATKQSHNSYSFALRMERIGEISGTERKALRSRRRHQHLYSICELMDGAKIFYCHYCHKRRP